MDKPAAPAKVVRLVPKADREREAARAAATQRLVDAAKELSATYQGAPDEDADTAAITMHQAALLVESVAADEPHLALVWAEYIVRRLTPKRRRKAP